MVDKIYGLKNNFVELIGKKISDRGIDRIDVQEMGMLVDMVKDLAEAEEKCWKAEYYRKVVEEMKGGSSGTSGYMTPSGYSSQMVRSGYDSLNQRSGYHGDDVENVRKMMHSITPEDRERLLREFM